MKKMKRRIAGVVLVVLLFTIVFSHTSFSVYAAEPDYDTDVVAEEGESVAEEGESVAEEDESVTEEDDSVTEEDESVTEEDESVTEEDESVTEEDESVAEEDESVAEEDESVAEEDESVAEEDESVAEEDESVAEEDESVTEEKDTISNAEVEIVVEDEKRVSKKTSRYSVNDIITFGKYEQDGNVENGKEDIEWLVLKVESDRVLVVSKYALDCKKYNTSYDDSTWESSSLRSWLNNEFKNDAFTSSEQRKLITASITNDDNCYYGTDGGNDTTDQVFCLSVSEVNDLIGYSNFDDGKQNGYSQYMIVEPTQYAINNGAGVYTITDVDYEYYLRDYGYSEDVVGRKGAWWWLRSPGLKFKDACYISADGNGGSYVDITVDKGGMAVRPAMFIKSTSGLPVARSEELLELREKEFGDSTDLAIKSEDEVPLKEELIEDGAEESTSDVVEEDSGVVDGDTDIVEETTVEEGTDDLEEAIIEEDNLDVCEEDAITEEADSDVPEEANVEEDLDTSEEGDAAGEDAGNDEEDWILKEDDLIDFIDENGDVESNETNNDDEDFSSDIVEEDSDNDIAE